MRAIGNRPGWTIAGGIAGLLGVVAWQLAGVNRLTPPTNVLSAAGAFAALSPEVPPGVVFRSETPGDSAAHYRRAIEIIRADTMRYEVAASAETAEGFESSEAFAALRAAAPLAGDAGLPTEPAARASYEPADDELDALVLVARCLDRTARLRLPTDVNRARTLFEAQFALGAKLFEGRVRYAEAAVGLSIARDAAMGLRAVAERTNDTRRASSAATFDRAAQGLLQQRLGPVWEAVAAVDGRLIAEHSGDVYALADAKTAERMWRVEAALALGRHRFNVDRAADRLAVPRRLDEMERAEKDAYVLAAIRTARGLTIEQYRTLR